MLWTYSPGPNQSLTQRALTCCPTATAPITPRPRLRSCVRPRTPRPLQLSRSQALACRPLLWRGCRDRGLGQSTISRSGTAGRGSSRQQRVWTTFGVSSAKSSSSSRPTRRHGPPSSTTGRPRGSSTLPASRQQWPSRRARMRAPGSPTPRSASQPGSPAPPSSSPRASRAPRSSSPRASLASRSSSQVLGTTHRRSNLRPFSRGHCPGVSASSARLGPWCGREWSWTPLWWTCCTLDRSLLALS
mmetsp:Transcript_26345/g.83437  ORF Transcript_26345/g.83437 Transcript_26345/m.83437 type:complete len:245 (-) Transcript_26345:206-940(-)